MQMSFSEKLILLMLADIHRRLGIQSEIDASLIKDAILDGQPWALYWEYGELLDISTPESVTRKTAEILEMWVHLEASFNALSKSEMAIFTEQCAKSSPLIFCGFDENDEIEYLGVATFLIEKMDRLSSLKGRNLGLRVTTLARYDRMLSIFKTLRPKLYGRNLNIEELIMICWMENPDEALNYGKN